MSSIRSRARGKSIFVHAKIMVIDDRLLRVGSSNLNNRSMGFDSECDLAVEVAQGSPDHDRVSEAILSVRQGLLCEHLDVEGDACLCSDGGRSPVLSSKQSRFCVDRDEHLSELAADRRGRKRACGE